MAKVLGVGGIFFLCDDVEKTRAWYQRALGIEISDFGGAMFAHAQSNERHGQAAMTIWSPFSGDSDYFKPSGENWMMNFMVDDLDGICAHLANEQVPLQGDRADEPYGRFAWIMDPDGRKVELWEPKAP